MKIYLILILVLFLVGCQSVVCEKPYMRFEESCCLDKDNNSICDNDEVKEQTKEPVIEEKPKETIIEEGPEEKITEEEPKPVEEPVPVEEEKNFEVEIGYMKGTIRLLDQAIVIVNIVNKKNYLETYVVNINDGRWTIRSDPYMSPMRVAAKPEGKNHVKLIIQPNKNYIKEAGNYTIDVSVRSEKVPETISDKIGIRVV